MSHIFIDQPHILCYILAIQQIIIGIAMDIQKLILKNIKKNKPLFAKATFCFVISSIALSIDPFFISRIIGYFETGNKETIIRNVILGLFLYLILKILQAVNQYFVRITLRLLENTLITNITADLFRKVHQHNIGYFDDEMTGRISTAISKSAQLMKSLSIDILYTLFRPLINFFFAFCIISCASIKLALCLTCLCIPFFYIFKILRAKIHSLWQSRGNTEREYNGIVTDSITNYKIVRYTGSIFNEKLFAFSRLKKYLKTSYNCETMRAFTETYLKFSETVFSLFCIIAIIYFASVDAISLADALFAFFSVTMLSQATSILGYFVTNFFEKYGELTSHIKLIDKPITIEDKPDAKNLNIKKANINYQNIFFAYTPQKQIFNNLNLKITAGQKVGLVGPSGAGKSTLINLLLRSYLPQSGKILINNSDINDITELSLHKNISYVPQDVTLFNRSLYENLKIANPQATQKEIIKAAKLAYIHDTIKNLEKGYDSIVGERGILLSGGERQRIAIARAILQNAPILILDEATSALDSEAEVMIQHALQTLMKNKTVIAIAHRLSTLRSMDRIIVLDSGKIIEDGSPQELLNKKDGLFKHLYDLQIDGYLPDKQQGETTDEHI